MKLLDRPTAPQGPLGAVPFAPEAPSAQGLQELVGQVGREVASPLDAALERVDAFATTGRIDRAGLRALRDEIEAARRLALSAQRIGRLVCGRVPQDAQRLSLEQALHDAVLQRSPEIAARGIDLRRELKPAEVMADAAMAAELLQSVLSWSFEHARSPIDLRVDIKNWPAHARLVCRFAHAEAEAVPEQDAPAARRLQGVQWQLLSRLAQTMGLVLKRDDRHGQTQLTLEFPRTLEPLAVPSGQPGSDMPGQPAPGAQPMVGRHVLVLSSRRETRNVLRDALRPLGLMVDYVASIDEARQFCDGGLPHAIVFESALAGENFRRLRSQLSSGRPALAFVEIAEQGRDLQVSDADGQRTARVGRDVLASALPGALVAELSRGG